MVERMLCMHEAQGSITCSSILFVWFTVALPNIDRNESGIVTCREVRVV
jgi:hypothetical protein